jgi:ATP-dependent Clp protease ATP-binding subunit ClpA
MMFERFTGDARTIVIEAQKHARRLGHRYIGCEHLLLAAVCAGEPASAALREHGVTPDAVENEIVRLVGRGQAAIPFGTADRDALAAIGIDLDAVRARIEATFGPDAFTRAIPGVCSCGGPTRRRSPVALLRRRRRCRGRAGAGQDASGARRSGHLPFTPRAKKSLERSLREAQARHDSYIGVEHITLALVTMDDGAVPPIVAALGTSQAALRAAILDRYRQAS